MVRFGREIDMPRLKTDESKVMVEVDNKGTLQIFTRLSYLLLRASSTSTPILHNVFRIFVRVLLGPRDIGFLGSCILAEIVILCVVVKDSVNYLDLINAKNYQRMLGMSIREERAYVEQQEQEDWKRQHREKEKEKKNPFSVDFALIKPEGVGS